MKLTALRVALFSVLTLLSTHALASERSVVISPNADYPGFDYAIKKDFTLDACSAACVADRVCKAFTYNAKAKWCFLKSDIGTLSEVAGSTGGKIVQPAEPPKAAEDVPPSPPLAFLDAAALDAARTFAEGLRQAPPPETADAAALRGDMDRKMFARDFAGAADAAKGVIALGADDYAIWRGLTLAYLATVTNDGTFKAQLNANATAAAIAAYERGGNDINRSEALGLLADALARSENYRAALDTYRQALKLHSTPALVGAYEYLLAQRGFRVTEQTVDSDSAEPRICLVLSDNLSTEITDFAPFVTLNGGAPSGLAAKDNQVCIEGLKHGERHTIVLRQGLPSANNETLQKDVAVTQFIRDRQAAVRFTGGNFVLPREGRQAIPMVSVNVLDAKLTLMRVDDRSLVNLLRSSQFMSQLNSYDAQQLANDFGETVWTGAVATEKKLNVEITTGIPVASMLSQRKPGVYVLTAEPASGRSDEWSSKATQWFVVTDLGLTTMSNANGMHVFVRSLSSAKAMGGIPVTLVARNNEVLGNAVTDATGQAKFDAGLLRGRDGAAPALVTAGAAGSDTAFMDLTRAAYDFSDRGVGGRDAPGPIDVFVYSERGIYRPGHTVYLTALARSDSAEAISNLPLTAIVSRPDAVEFQRYTLNDEGLGGRSLALKLPETAMRGTWTAAIHTDPKQPAIASYRFLVDDYVPDRIEFDLKSTSETVSLEGPSSGEVDARYLYGAPAAGLALEGEFVLKPTRSLAAHPGYWFGLDEINLREGRTALADLGVTGEDGKASFEYTPTEVPETTQPLTGTLIVRIAEKGGRAVERQVEVPVAANQGQAGIKPLFTDLGEGQNAEFEVISLDDAGQRNAGKFKWEIVKINRNFQWYQTGGSWNYQSTEYTERVAGGEIDTAVDSAVRVSGTVAWDTYRLNVESLEEDGPAASYQFYAGWYGATASAADSPDILRISLDKQGYKPGETAKLKIVPRFAGVALVTVLGEGVIETKEVAVGVEGVEVPLTVSEAWSAATYVTATLYRPANTGDDKMPGRAVGVAYAGRDTADRTHDVKVAAPAQVLPNRPLTLDIAAGAGGGDTYVTVAAVDVGILNLTRYLAPKPQEWYFGKRRLGLEFRDIYGQLINGALGALGQVRSGAGDEEDAAGLMTIEGSPPSHRAIAFYSGIVKTDAQGKAQVTFDIPEFNGTLRVMAVAWSKRGVGNGALDVVVRDPVVVSESLPRFLAPGDSSRLRLDIANTDGPDGDYALSVSAADGLEIAGAPGTVKLGKGASASLLLPVKALTAGYKSIVVSLDHASGLHVERNLGLLVRDGQLPVSTKRIVTIGPGQTLSLTPDLLAGNKAGSGAITVAITRSGALDVPGILEALDRYPYGCTEQTTSRALPLVYLDEVARRAGLEGDTTIRERVQEAIFRVLANQSSTGSFGLWGPDSGDLWLDSYVSDFLTRARERGYDVPAQPFESALQNLQNELSYITTIEDRDAEVAYATYVLARNRRASLGDLRFYAETKLAAFETPIAKAQVGAALAFYGDRERAERTLIAAYDQLRGLKDEYYNRYDYGSNLRDGAAILALAGEGAPGAGFIPALAKRVSNAQAQNRWTSTQEQSWMLLAAHALMDGGAVPKLNVAGAEVTGDYVRKYGDGELKSSAVAIVNTAGYPVDAVITTTGVATVADPPGGNGFSISRDYYMLAGQPANLATLKQNDRLLVVLKVSQFNTWPTRMMVTDLLPSGLEIDNPSLVESADMANFSWLQAAPANAHLEFRDDRFAAALNRPAGDNAAVTLAYVVRAVSPGTFVLPGAHVEDMYRPHLNAITAAGTLDVVGALK